MKKSRLLFAGGVFVASLAAPSAVLAQAPQWVSGSVGPVPVPNVPVQICVGATCQQTPALSSVGLAVGALTEGNAVPPTFRSGSCAAGTGGVLFVTGGSAGAIVTGTLNGTLPNGARYEQSIGAPINLAPNATTTISACTAAGAVSAAGMLGSALVPMNALVGGLLPGGLTL